MRWLLAAGSRLLHGVTPEREPGAQAIDTFERGCALAHLEHTGTGRGVIDRLGFVAGNESRRRRSDLGEHLGVAVGQIHGTRTQEITDDIDDVIGGDEVETLGEQLPLWSLVHGADRTHHPVVKDDAVMEPLGQVLPTDIPPDRIRGPGAERAPVGRLWPKQSRQTRGQIRIRLGHPIVAKDTVIDGEHRLHVRRCGSPIHAAHLHPDLRRPGGGAGFVPVVRHSRPLHKVGPSCRACQGHALPFGPQKPRTPTVRSAGEGTGCSYAGVCDYPGQTGIRGEQGRAGTGTSSTFGRVVIPVFTADPLVLCQDGMGDGTGVGAGKMWFP